MEAIRIIKTVNSDRLPELNKFRGKNVEIIILPDINDDHVKMKCSDIISELSGSCPDLPDGITFQKEMRDEWDR